MKTISNKISEINSSIRNKSADLAAKLHTRAVYGKEALCNNAGEGYIDTAVKVLIAVVLGALVLAGLYAILKDTVMPTVTQKIKDMFNYGG